MPEISVLRTTTKPDEVFVMLTSDPSSTPRKQTDPPGPGAVCSFMELRAPGSARRINADISNDSATVQIDRVRALSRQVTRDPQSRRHQRRTLANGHVAGNTDEFQRAVSPRRDRQVAVDRGNRAPLSLIVPVQAVLPTLACAAADPTSITRNTPNAATTPTKLGLPTQTNPSRRNIDPFPLLDRTRPIASP